MQSTLDFDLFVDPGAALCGEIPVPGDKSISHRALILGAIADGCTRISGCLDSADTIATLQALRQLGVAIDRQAPTELQVQGVGLHGLQRPRECLNLGNSGTSARLLAGLLAGQTFRSELSGDESLRQRPMLRVAEPLRRMGARVECTAAGTLPMAIAGSGELQPIEYTSPVASAQLKSAVLLAGLYASGRTCVIEPAPTRDHTERMLRHFGLHVVHDGNRVCVHSGVLRAQSVNVPGDLSSAAFLLVAASLVPGSRITLPGIGVNPSRSAVIDILRQMGANIEVDPRPGGTTEPLADLHVTHAPLRGIEIPGALVANAIDEMPVLLAAAAGAEGMTRLRGAGELRVKESDRISAVASGLRALGIKVDEYADGMDVYGGRVRGGEVDSRADHRIAMAFAVLGLVAEDRVRVRGCRNIDTSFPGFVDALQHSGAEVAVQETG